MPSAPLHCTASLVGHMSSEARFRFQKFIRGISEQRTLGELNRGTLGEQETIGELNRESAPASTPASTPLGLG
jgi:hypothetical protein